MSGARQKPSTAAAADTVPAGAAPVSPEAAALSFEDALAELEKIVRGLEGGQQKLEDAIGAYERGARLRAHCEAKLAEAEARVQAIVAAADGSLSLRSAD